MENTFLAIRRIKELSFELNEQFFDRSRNDLRIEISLRLSYNPDANFVFLLARIFYRYETEPHPGVLADTSVQTVFEVSDLQNYIHSNNVILPDVIITAMVAAAVSHARAIVAKNVAGTSLQDNHLSFIDAEDVARHFFPRMFESAIVDPPSASVHE